MKLNNIYDVMSYLSDEDNYKKSIGFVLNKLYEETIKAQNDNGFLPMFLQDKKYFSINVDINKFAYYLYKSFIENKDIKDSEFLDDNFMYIIKAAFSNKKNINIKYKKIFWLIFLGYQKGLIYVSSKNLDIIKNVYFTPILFKNNSGEIAKMLAINISTAHLYKFFPEELAKLKILDYTEHQTNIAFGINKVAEFEAKLEKQNQAKPKVLMGI
jgi:hypothetical protein